jgi:hypothetical protein
MNGDLNSLHTSVSNANFDIGNLEEFTAKMRTPEQRKKFFDAMTAQDVDLGDYNEYETKLGGSSDDGEAEIETPTAKDNSQADVAVTEENTASNGGESSTESQDNLLTDTIMGASYQVSEEGIASGKKNREAARNFFSTKKGKLEQALDDIDIVVPLTKKDIASVETDLQLAQSPKIKELEAKLKEAPSMSQEAADILKEIESIKSATTESRVNPRNKSYQKNIDLITQHENKVAEITNRVVTDGGDEDEVKKQVGFYEKNNPEQTRINTANYEVETINRALDNFEIATSGNTYSSFSEDEDEKKELNNLVEQQIIEDLSIKEMGKAAEDNYDLPEKEAIILAAKDKVLRAEFEKANEVYNSAVVVDFVKEKNDLEAQLKAMSKYDDEGLLVPFKDQIEVDKYNGLVNKLNGLQEKGESVKEIVLGAQERLSTLSTELGFNAIKGIFDNNFEMTDNYQKWRDEYVKERGFWGGTYDAVATLVQGGINIAADATLGFGVSIAGMMDNAVNEDNKYYTGHDMVQDAYKNFANFNWAGTSDYGADILDEKGDLRLFKGNGDNARIVSKTIANMLPFTIGNILAMRRGDLKPMKGMWSTIGPKFMTSAKGRGAIRMMDASYRMTINDNYHDGLALGLDKSQSWTYANMLSFGTGLSQMIMPDANFLGSNTGKIILKGFVNNLKSATTKKAIGGATKQLITNMGKELGEEFIEVGFGDIAKYSVGLAHSPDILDLRTQKETIAATLMLSGSLGSIGTVNDIKNAKKQVYQQYKDNGQDIIDVLDDNLKVANARFENARTQKSKDNHQATIDQINDAKNYGQSIINAVNSAPENVSDDQIDLLIQKQELVKQKQGKDKAISVGIDNQIKEIDEKISNSVIRQGEKAQAEKNIATVKQAIKKGGLDGNVSEMTSKEISDIKEEGFDSKSAAGQFGYIKQRTDGSFDIVLNKDKPMVGVESHEFMHAVLYKTVGNNKEIQDNLGDALIDHVLDNLEGDKSILGKRLSAYGKYNKEGEFIRDENFGEETITIMSESIVNGSLKFDENFFTKVGDIIRRFSQNYLGKEITFDTGRDVYNFIKDYSKNVKDGKINKAILKVAKEGAKGKLVEGKVEPKAGTQMAKDTESKTPEELVKTIQRGGNPKKVKEAQDKLAPQFELLALSEKALNYDTRKGDIAREDVVAEAMTYFDGIVERFTLVNPKTGEKRNFSTFVIANMRPKRQVIYQKVKPLIYGETTSTDTKEARQIEDTSSETTNTEDTFVQKINILQDFAIANRVADKIKALVKVVKGDNFKSIISKYAGKVGELIFEVPANKIMEGGANLAAVTKYTEGMPAPAEAQNIQRFFNAPENADKFIKTLPLYNVTDKTADINKIGENLDVSRDTYGYAIGLKGLPLDYFYESYTDPAGEITSPKGRSKGLTSQTQVKRLKPQFRKPTSETVEQFKKDLGITPKNEPNVYSRDIGQLLKGVAKVHSINAAISGAQRFQEAKLKTAPVTEQKAIKQQTADITAAQSKIAFSKAAAQINILSVFELETKGIDELLKQYGVDGVFGLKNEKQIDEYITAIKKDLLPLMPKEFWFGKPDTNGNFGTVFTGSSKVLGTTVASKKLYKEYYEPAIKALANDTDVEFGTGIKGVNDYSISSYKTIFKDTKTIKANIKNGKIKEWNKKVALIHEAMWFRMGDAIGKDKNKAKAIGNYMKMTGSDTKHWHKRGAQFVGYSVKPQLRYEYEHAMPATAAYLYLMDAALSKSDFKASYKVVKNNYKLMALDKAMDKKLTAVGLQRSMPRGWDLLENNWWDRYFNSLVANQDGGIDPSSIRTINGKTFGEEFNVNAEGNSSIVKTGIKYSKTLSNAINFSRSTNNPTKGITVLDFDDTLATTKSGVRANIPNTDGLPKPGRKVIFLAGGAGSGKGNVISKLGLKDQGFKVVNSDISLEWLKKNSGLPENMNDFTKEQRSKLGSLQHQARGIAKRKMMKYQGEGGGVVVDGTGGSIKSMEKLVNEFKAKGYDVSMVFTETSLDVALERNAARKERSLLDKIVEKNHEAVQGNKDGFKEMFGDRFMEVNTDNLSQKDAMPSKLTNKMNDFVSGYENRRLDAEEFARDGASILEQGGTFDFSEFNEVVEGQTAPLFEKAMKLQGKFGNKDMFVLTARPAESAQAIFEFLQANGLDIPLENITGLANSTAEAKAAWMVEKVADGYNDFYFADDAIQNVKAVQDVLDQFDVKSKVQQARADFVKGDPQVVKLLEESSMNDVKNVDRLTKPGTYDNIKFSKAHRAEYENTISKNRPDLVKSKLVSKTIDRMFDYIDSLDVPTDKRRKYEKITTKWLATSNVKLGEDSYKIQQAVELAEKHKEDIFSYRNPNEIIEKYAGKSKAEPTNPKNVKEFGEGRVFNKKHGITVHEVEDTKEGMTAVRKVADTHWGPKSNPWCIIARSEKQRVEPRQYGYESVATKSDAQARKQQLESEGFIVEIRAHKKDYRGIYPGKSIDGKRVDMRYELDIKEVKEGPGIMEDAWQNWTVYDKSRKYIVFQNGRLSSFYADDQYWDRMDSPTDAPVIQIKEGNVTSKVELVPIGDGNVDEFVMETRTTSKDKKTVTTEVLHETQDGYEVGTKIIENRVNGITVKSTRSRPGFDRQGNDVMHAQEIINFDKSGKATNNVTFNSEGLARAINRYGMPFGEMSINDIVQEKGDLLSHEVNDGDISYYYGDVLINGQKTEIGWGMPSDLDLRDFVTTSPNGEVRADVKKLLEVDPNVKGLPKSNIMFSKGVNREFNDILEGSTGVESIKEFSDAQARLRGQKTKYKSIIPASAQDFQGLLYNFLGRGKQGEKDMAFFKKALIDPFARGINELNASRQSAANDFENLNKSFPDTKKILNEKIDGVYTVDQAIRVYLWDKAGFEVPGLSKRDLKTLVDFVQGDPKTQAYADAIGLISKKDAGYSKPKDYWLAESIASDLLSDGAIGDLRPDLLAEWIQNKNLIFSKENLNKIEAIYGSNFREALEDMLYRMETGRNRPTGGSRLVNGYMNWVNNSVGAIMFINLRSATLQTISATNYVNWTDNNPLKAAAAFANQPQFWSDFSMIWNSPYLKQRRSGNQRGINEAELSEAIAGSDNKAKAALAWLLKKGFTPTQLADSFAISMGGATFLRNRINKYVKEGMSQKDAEAKAWIDFQETTEVNQQSARPDMISQQQASPLGRLILAFQNTPMQYARIMNKATRDLANGRGDYRTHISKIAYYGFVQSVIFGALQSALYASLGDDDEEDFDKKKERILNQMVDSWLTGIGVGGKAIGTVKNTIMEYFKQRDKGWNADHAYTLLTILSFSPPIGSKLRKIYSSIKTEEFNRGVFEKRGFSLDNPIWSGIGNVIEGVTNAPLGRMANLMLQLDNAMDSSHAWWQRVALILGQNTWDLGIKDPDIEAAKDELAEEKKVESKIKAKVKKEEKKKEKEEENKAVIEENKKKSKKDGVCSAVSKGGDRCGNVVVGDKSFCTVHEKVTQNSTGKKSQCKKIKKGGKRCGMQTSAKGGYCYYHD